MKQFLQDWENGKINSFTNDEIISSLSLTVWRIQHCILERILEGRGIEDFYDCQTFFGFMIFGDAPYNLLRKTYALQADNIIVRKGLNNLGYSSTLNVERAAGKLKESEEKSILRRRESGDENGIPIFKLVSNGGKRKESKRTETYVGDYAIA